MTWYVCVGRIHQLLPGIFRLKGCYVMDMVWTPRWNFCSKSGTSSVEGISRSEWVDRVAIPNHQTQKQGWSKPWHAGLAKTCQIWTKSNTGLVCSIWGLILQFDSSTKPKEKVKRTTIHPRPKHLHIVLSEIPYRQSPDSQMVHIKNGFWFGMIWGVNPSSY